MFTALSRQVDVAPLLVEWGLAAKRRATYASLSGGQRQRLHVALALVTRPRLVLLDEMTTGLDPNARREVWELVEQVRREGTTVVLVTHFMDEAERLCDRVAVMVEGGSSPKERPASWSSVHGGRTRVSFAVASRAARPRPSPGVLGVGRRGRVEMLGRGSFLVGLGHALTGAGLADVELVWGSPASKTRTCGWSRGATVG